MGWKIHTDLTCSCGKQGTISRHILLCQACYMRDYYHNKMTSEQKVKRTKRQTRYQQKLRLTDDEKWARSKAQTMNSYIFRKYNRGGISTEELTKFIMDNINKPCKYCGDVSRHVDHVVPLSDGGHHKIDNLEMICKYCNLSKNDRSEQEFLEWIKKISLRAGT